MAEAIVSREPPKEILMPKQMRKHQLLRALVIGALQIALPCLAPAADGAEFYAICDRNHIGNRVLV